MIKLDKRLSSILNEIEGTVLADIGCDHGKLTVSALGNGKCQKAIAGDISADSLNKTISLVKELGFEDKVECRVSDGFENIHEDLDTAVIAGLGGYEIKDILSKPFPQIKRFIICPHQNVMIARRAINQIGYGALKDYVVKEGKKYYQIIVAEKDLPLYDINELRFGKNEPESDDYYQMLKDRKAVLENRFLGKEIPKGEMQDEYQEIIRCLK